MAIEDKNEFKFPDEGGGKVEEEKLEIEIQDDTPPADQGRKPMETAPEDPTDAELASYDQNVRKRIQHFTKGYHEERRAKETAQRERDELQRVAKAIVDENQQLRGSLSQGQTALVEQAKLTVKGELEQAQKAYETAVESFDTAAIVKAQQQLMSATIRADKLAGYKPPPLQEKKTDVQTQQQPQPLDPKLVSWREDNAWFGAKKGMTAYALGVHEDLANEGVAVGSAQYYAKLDTEMRKRFPDEFDDSGSTSGATTRTQKPNVVASATRSTAARKVVLTKTQVSTAKRLGVPLELYARKVAELERNQNA